MLLWFTREHCSSIAQYHARELNIRTRKYTARERKVTSELYRRFDYFFLVIMTTLYRLKLPKVMVKTSSLYCHFKLLLASSKS